jgi:L-2-hydroxyglutarate oxidase LhgO
MRAFFTSFFFFFFVEKENSKKVSGGCVVVGGGAVGLSILRRLSQQGITPLFLIERNREPGLETSSRSSNVVHAGVHGPEHWLKRRLAIAGRAMLVDFCAAKGVKLSLCGKLIVAVGHGEVAALRGIQEAAGRCGVAVERIGPGEVARLQGGVVCTEALLSPGTGILDSVAYMEALRADAEAGGAEILTNHSAIGITSHSSGSGLAVDVRDPEGVVTSLPARFVVNAAGLGSCDLARTITPHTTPKLSLCKGNYFSWTKPALNMLVYPLPDPRGGLGIHATIDLAGRVRFGPDVEWIDSYDHSVTLSALPLFEREVKRYLPDVQLEDLHPDYAGVRPKISAKGEPAADFMIQSSKEHGIKGLVHLFGIESPGLTASLAIADHVAQLILKS